MGSDGCRDTAGWDKPPYPIGKRKTNNEGRMLNVECRSGGGSGGPENADLGPENAKIEVFRAENGSNGLVFAPAGELGGLADPAGQAGGGGRSSAPRKKGNQCPITNIQFPRGGLAFRINLWHSSLRERVVPKGQGVGLGGAAPVGDSGRDQRVHKR